MVRGKRSMKGREKQMGRAYCFCGKLMRSICTMWLLQHTPWVTSTTPKGNWTPSFFFFFYTFLSNMRWYMSSILPQEWANKTTACCYMYCIPSSPRNIFQEHTPSWGVGMWLASQVIFFGVAALLCSLIRFPFPSGVISLSVAPANLTAMVHLEKKNGGTPYNNSTSTTPPPPPLHNNAFILGRGNNVSSRSIWTISNIWIMLFWRDWEGGRLQWSLGEVPVG